MTRAIDRAAALWSHASLHDADGRTATGDPDVVPDGLDLNQLVTDSGAIPAGCVTWSNLPHHLWYPHGSPAGDAMAFLRSAGIEPTPMESALIDACSSQAVLGYVKKVDSDGTVHIDLNTDPPVAS